MKKTLFLLLLCVSHAMGQQSDYRAYAEARLAGPLAPDDETAISNPSVVIQALIRLDAAKPAVQRIAANEVKRAVARRRSDVQLGANSSSGGSTSLVSKAGIPELFSAAAESGAFSRESEGTVTTFRASAIGIKRLLSNEDCSITSTCYERFAAKGLEVHVAFDRGSGGSVVPLEASGTPNVGTLGALRPTGRVSGAGLKWDFLARNTGSGLAKELEDAATTLTASGQALGEAVRDLVDDPTAQVVLQRFRSILFPLLDKKFKGAPAGPAPADALITTYADRTEEAFGEALAQVRVGANLSALQTKFETLLSTEGEFIKARDTALNKVLYKSHGALELNHVNPASTPNMLVARFSYTNALGAVEAGKSDKSGPLTTFSVNVAASIYENLPANLKVGRFRDMQASLQLDRKLGKAEWELRPVFSLAGYYQYMVENDVIEFKQDAKVPNTNIPLPRPAVEVLNTKGSIVIGQAKLTIPIGSGVSIPVSISGANRTELIKNSINFNAQVGISFDLSGLLHR